jgi:hypothetical protein
MSTSDPDVVPGDEPADVTASGQGCVANVSDTLQARPTTLTVRNDSSSVVNFELLRLAVTYDEIVGFFADEVERIAAGEPLPVAERAAFTDRLGSVELQPGEEGSVGGALRAGTYTVLCTYLDANGADLTPLPSGPLTVTGRNATWATTGNDINRQATLDYDFVCPPNGEPHEVDGTDIYLTFSSICTAAVHAGVITLDEGGPITIRFWYHWPSYQGSERNGISSSDSGGGNGFRIIPPWPEVAPPAAYPWSSQMSTSDS